MCICRFAIGGKAARMSATPGEAGVARATAQALRLLQDAGAAVKGRTRTEELHFGWASPPRTLHVHASILMLLQHVVKHH